MRKKPVTHLKLVKGDYRPDDRPLPPVLLTREEAEEWDAIVGAMKPDYFTPPQFPLLSQLCRHVVAANTVAMMIDNCFAEKRKIDLTKLTSLLTMQIGESNSIIRLCRQLRLSHQATIRYESRKSRPVSSHQAPWEGAQMD